MMTMTPGSPGVGVGGVGGSIPGGIFGGAPVSSPNNKSAPAITTTTVRQEEEEEEEEEDYVRGLQSMRLEVELVT